jgi:carbonic anhydrase
MLSSFIALLISKFFFRFFFFKIYNCHHGESLHTGFRSKDRFIKNFVSTKGDDFWNRPGPWDDPNLDTLLNANKRWSNRMKLTNPEFFEGIKRGHAPKILWIGCSDARVPANEIIGEPPGSVFVHRNIANMVVNTDFNCMSVIQYAVDVLEVKHIIVCGHYDCGGIRAALEPFDHKSPLENWLRNIRDTHRLHKEELSAIPDLRQRQRRLVEINVVEQVAHNELITITIIIIMTTIFIIKLIVTVMMS